MRRSSIASTPLRIAGCASAKAMLASTNPSGDAAIIGAAAIVIPEEGLALLQLEHRIGELNLVAGAPLLARQNLEYLPAAICSGR